MLRRPTHDARPVRRRLASAAARLADGATVAEAADAAGGASRSQVSRASREATGRRPCSAPVKLSRGHTRAPQSAALTRALTHLLSTHALPVLR